MKQLLFFLALFVGLTVCSQTVVQRAGNANTVQDGHLFAGRSFRPPVYNDTAAANLIPQLDSAGKIIFTRATNSMWYRGANPKRWEPFASGGGGSAVTTINVYNDTTILICTVAGACDTITINTTITNITTAVFLTDSTIAVCDTLQTCDTVTIPRQVVNVYQNGLTSPAAGVVEWGGTLLKPTTVSTGYFTATVTGYPVRAYPLSVVQSRDWTGGTGILSLKHGGGDPATDAPQPDVANKVRFSIDYTGAAYPVSGTDLTGYFGDRIGYFAGVNATGGGSYGLRVDDTAAKVGGVLLHTWDTATRDAVTLYGKHPTHGTYVAPITSGGTLAPYRIATFRNDGEVQLWDYLSGGTDGVGRNDGVSRKVLYTDSAGVVQLGHLDTAYYATVFDVEQVSGVVTATTNQNLGAGYRILVPSSQGLKTLFGGYAVSLDSTTNANALTFKADTSLLSTLYALRDTARVIRTLHTAANGLTDSSGRFVLGGALYKETTVAYGSHATSWTGARASGAAFTVSNSAASGTALSGSATGSGSSIGVQGLSSTYIGVYGSSVSSSGVQGQSSSSAGVVGASSSGVAFSGTINPSSTSTVATAMTLTRTTSGTPAAGIGTSVSYAAEHASGGLSNTMGYHSFHFTDVTTATRTAQFEVWSVSNAVIGRKLALAGSGQMTLDAYGDGLISGTSTYLLGVDADGNVVEVSAGGGAGDGIGHFVSAGTNITFTGSGTSGSPYVIATKRDQLSKSITLAAPTAAENVSLFYTDRAITLAKVAESIAGTTPSVTYNLRWASSRDVSGTAVFAADRTVTSTSGATVSSFASASIPAGSYVWLETSSVGGDVEDFSLTVLFNED